MGRMGRGANGFQFVYTFSKMLYKKVKNSRPSAPIPFHPYEIRSGRGANETGRERLAPFNPYAI